MDGLIAIQHGHVHPTVHDQLAERRAEILVDVEQDVRMPGTHGTQQRQRQRRRAGAGRQPHRNLARQRLAGALDVGLSLFVLAQDQLGVAIERRACLSGRDAAFGTHEQLLLELVFERDQLLAQRRLGDMKHFGGLRQAADIDDLHEVLQTPQVHGSRVSTLRDGNNNRASAARRTVLKKPSARRGNAKQPVRQRIPAWTSIGKSRTRTRTVVSFVS